MKKIWIIILSISAFFSLAACATNLNLNQAEQLIKGIEIQYALHDAYDSVRNDLNLQTTLDGFDDVMITWLSLNQEVITHDGFVTRRRDDTSVVLVLRLKIGELTAQRNFELVVLGTHKDMFVTTFIFNEVIIVPLELETQLSSLDTPKRTGYQFLYWETLSGELLDDAFIITEDMSIRAVFIEAITYTYKVFIYKQITQNGGYQLFDTLTFEDVKDTALSYEETYEGFVFNSVLSDVFGALNAIDLTFDLYYDVQTFEVTYYYNGNIIDSKTYTFRAVIFFPEREDVLGWSLTPSGGLIEADFKVESDLVLYAIIEETALSYSGYYESLDGVSNEDVFIVLRALITEYTYQNYDNARDILQDSDEDPTNPSKIILVYNRASVISTWDQGNTWNREHVWPQSMLLNSIQKADTHNLKPANPSINSSRGNNKFAQGSNTFGIVDGGFYPGDEDKGDIARIVFYMHVRWGLNIHLVGQLNILLKWHQQDPVDTFEARRNEVIYEHSKNRNPFIDHPELVTRLFGQPTFYTPYPQHQYEVYVHIDIIAILEKNKTHI